MTAAEAKALQDRVEANRGKFLGKSAFPNAPQKPFCEVVKQKREVKPMKMPDVSPDGLTLRFDGLKCFPSLNSALRDKHGKKRKEIGKILDWQIALQKPLKHLGRVKITYTRFACSLLDEDALASSAKCLNDALVRAKVIVDDNSKYLNFVALQAKVSRMDARGVVIVIEPLE